MSAGNTGADEPPGITALSFAAAHTARHFQDFGKRRTQWHFIVARTLNMAGDAEQFGTAGVRNAFVGKRLAAVTDDKRYGSEGFGIVDGGRLAVQAERGGERRFEARLAFCLPAIRAMRFLRRKCMRRSRDGRKVRIRSPNLKYFTQNLRRALGRVRFQSVDNLRKFRRECSCSPLSHPSRNRR